MPVAKILKKIELQRSGIENINLITIIRSENTYSLLNKNSFNQCNSLFNTTITPLPESNSGNG